MIAESANTTLPTASDGERGIEVLAIVVAVVGEWRLIVTWAMGFLAVCVAIVLLLQPQFVGTASILPTGSRAQNDTFASLFYGQRGPGALYVGLLESRSVQDEVLDRTGLIKVLRAKDRQTARNILTAKTTITEGADSLVTIEVKDPDAKRAAEIANAYLDSLSTLNERLGISESTQTREYFERQLQQEREMLNQAERGLEHTQQSTGLVDPAAQMQLGLGAIGAVRAQITTLQVQLAALLQRETEQAPEVQAVRSQIRELQATEKRMESTSQAPLGAPPAAGRLPETNMDYQRAQRDVKEREFMVQSLASGYETARLAESAGRSAFQVVDRAVVPERKSWPPRRPLVALAFVFSWLLGLAAATLKLLLRRLTADPVSQPHLKRLRSIFRGA